MSEPLYVCRGCGDKLHGVHTANLCEETHRLEAENAKLQAENARIRVACRDALEHVQELREAWSSGAICESDGRGGTRSNRNVDVEVLLRASLEGEAGDE